MNSITIARRFNGPPDSGNGGYVCGAFAVAAGAGLRVRLLSPPPLQVPLEVSADGEGRWRLGPGEAPVASGTPARLELEVPKAPQYVQAVWASQHYAGFREHIFPECFVCGPLRRRGDGLRIFPGMLDSGIVAAPWLPADSLDGGDGKVAVEHHWAAKVASCSPARRSSTRTVSSAPGRSRRGSSGSERRATRPIARVIRRAVLRHRARPRARGMRRARAT